MHVQCSFTVVLSSLCVCGARGIDLSFTSIGNGHSQVASVALFLGTLNVLVGKTLYFWDLCVFLSGIPLGLSACAMCQHTVD